MSFPTKVIINPDGKIEAVLTGTVVVNKESDNFTKKMEQLLGIPLNYPPEIYDINHDVKYTYIMNGNPLELPAKSESFKLIDPRHIKEVKETASTTPEGRKVKTISINTNQSSDEKSLSVRDYPISWNEGTAYSHYGLLDKEQMAQMNKRISKLAFAPPTIWMVSQQLKIYWTNQGN